MGFKNLKDIDLSIGIPNESDTVVGVFGGKLSRKSIRECVVSGKPQIKIGGEEPTDDNIVLWVDENDDGYTISYPDVKQVEDEIYGEALKLIVGGIE